MEGGQLRLGSRRRARRCGRCPPRWTTAVSESPRLRPSRPLQVDVSASDRISNIPPAARNGEWAEASRRRPIRRPACTPGAPDQARQHRRRRRGALQDVLQDGRAARAAQPQQGPPRGPRAGGDALRAPPRTAEPGHPREHAGAAGVPHGAAHAGGRARVIAGLFLS